VQRATLVLQPASPARLLDRGPRRRDVLSYHAVLHCNQITSSRQVHQPMVLQEVRRAPRATQEQLPESLVKRVVPGPPRPAVLLLAVEHLRK